MLVDMNTSMLTALIRGCYPSYEILDHPLIKNKGYYTGGHSDKWTWNSSFGECTEESLWETYQLLEDPVPYPKRIAYKQPDGWCSQDELYRRLMSLNGVSHVLIIDHLDLSISISVVGGNDKEIADVLCNSLMMFCKTIGDYKVSTTISGFDISYNIYREIQHE